MNVLRLELWCLTPLSTISQLYIVEVNFIGGGNRSARRKPPTCGKSLTNFMTYCCIEYTSPERDSSSNICYLYSLHG